MENDDELGRRILAALISYQLGYAGVDHALKQFREQPIDPSWTKLGFALLYDIHDQRDAKRLAAMKVPNITI